MYGLGTIVVTHTADDTKALRQILQVFGIIRTPNGLEFTNKILHALLHNEHFLHF